MDHLQNFQNQNVNTENLPIKNLNNINTENTIQINLDKKRIKNIPISKKEEHSISITNKLIHILDCNNLNKNLREKSNDTSNQTIPGVIYNLFISNKEKENFSSEFQDLIRGIIDTNDENFLTGSLNPIEYLITKFTDIRKEEINQIKSLKLKINQNFSMLNEFGIYLNNLEELNLENSRITSIEAIGSSFVSLTNLNVSNCNLVDLTGLICFTNLEILDCSHNFIFDLIEFEMCHSLISLNLEDNKIEDDENISYLSGLEKLRKLNLNGNKIQENPKYQNLIAKYLPQLEQDENF